MSQITWLEAKNPNGPRIPKPGRTAGITKDNKLFLWAGYGGNENAVVMCAGYDGIGFEIFEDHAYMPEDWMVQEYPQLKDLCEKIRATLMKYKAEHPEG